MPRSPGETGLSLLFYHKLTSGFTTSIALSLTYSRIVPQDSTIFIFIKVGDLSGLQKLLNDKQAFLSDRDTNGRCLLNVSAPSQYDEPLG